MHFKEYNEKNLHKQKKASIFKYCRQFFKTISQNLSKNLNYNLYNISVFVN